MRNACLQFVSHASEGSRSLIAQSKASLLAYTLEGCALYTQSKAYLQQNLLGRMGLCMLGVFKCACSRICLEPLWVSGCLEQRLQVLPADELA